MPNSDLYMNEIIKMIPVITGALITGIIALISTAITHRFTVKKEKNALMLSKIEELSKELSEYHAIIIQQSFYLASTGQLIDVKDKTFHLNTLVNIYVPQLLPVYDSYTKEVHANINSLMGVGEKKFEVDKVQKLYTDLMKSIADEAKRYLS
ncbi:MAG: hypothetical protein IE880_05355 [Epsilonproteobacteria bacterium]|nr:hypothetical protein [Campylobacterota bacterium]